MRNRQLIAKIGVAALLSYGLAGAMHANAAATIEATRKLQQIGGNFKDGDRPARRQL